MYHLSRVVIDKPNCGTKEIVIQKKKILRGSSRIYYSNKIQIKKKLGTYLIYSKNQKKRMD